MACCGGQPNPVLSLWTECALSIYMQVVVHNAIDFKLVHAEHKAYPLATAISLIGNQCSTHALTAGCTYLTSPQRSKVTNSSTSSCRSTSCLVVREESDKFLTINGPQPWHSYLSRPEQLGHLAADQAAPKQEERL